jgi:glycosyltransferase involved in cell wall biosynthesis
MECTVYVMPSSGEGFDRSILNAALKPVVAAAAGGAAEVVGDGIDGVLIRYGDVSVLIQSLTMPRSIY